MAGHPFRNALINDAGESSPYTIQGDYFRKEVWRYDHMRDSIDPDLKVPGKSYKWNWTMGEVVTAFCEAGLRIIFLHEFPLNFYDGYTPHAVQNDRGKWFPCTFSLKAAAA